jgi:NAD(P)-dependent dehydrogenase (short-subunit alcohol dehydrogenase family)
MGPFTPKRTAFVTGASYGVGAATALALASDGFDVAVSATRAGNLCETVAKLAATGIRALPLVLDLRSQASIERRWRMSCGVRSPGRWSTMPALTAQAAVDVSRRMVRGDGGQSAGTFFLTQQIGRHLIGGSGRAPSSISRRPTD